nr:unnamed protein product [Ananas comosus var. bracteatus]
MAVQAQCYPSEALFLTRGEREKNGVELPQPPSSFLDPSPTVFFSNGARGRKRARDDAAAAAGASAPPPFPATATMMSLAQLQNQAPPPPLVSTGLRLAFEDQTTTTTEAEAEREASVAAQIKQHKDEIEQFVSAQTEQLRRAVGERWRRQQRALLATAEAAAARRLREKEAEAERAARRRRARGPARASPGRVDGVAGQGPRRAGRRRLPPQPAPAGHGGGCCCAAAAAAADERGDAGPAEDAASAYVDPERVEPERACRACGLARRRWCSSPAATSASAAPATPPLSPAPPAALAHRERAGPFLLALVTTTTATSDPLTSSLNPHPPNEKKLYEKKNTMKNMVDAFRNHIMQTKDLGTCPVRQIGGCSFLYMRISNVYIVIVVSSNANVACAFKFVVEAVSLFKSYFGGAFDEDAIKNNFVLIYELLDEIMDFGYPQNLSPEILKLYITQQGFRSPFSSKSSDRPVPNATLQVTGAVGWRREGLVYKKNEVFLDIVESVNLLMSSKGSVLRCDVTGKILMKCFLSGMPDLKLGLNDKLGLEKEAQLKARPTKSGKTIELDDVTFHQCVNLTRFNSEKTVSFVPPDGEFELMKYRISEGINLPFRVLPTIKELGRTRMEVNVKVKSVFGAKMFALGVVIKVPVPKQTAKTSFQVTSGKARYNAPIDSIVWKIRKFPGQTEATMSAEVELITTMGEKKPLTRPPIQMEFQVPMFTASGLRVRFLKVWEKSGYNTVEWVRYITKAGSYEIRC